MHHFHSTAKSLTKQVVCPRRRSGSTGSLPLRIEKGAPRTRSHDAALAPSAKCERVTNDASRAGSHAAIHVAQSAGAAPRFSLRRRHAETSIAGGNSQATTMICGLMNPPPRCSSSPRRAPTGRSHLTTRREGAGRSPTTPTTQASRSRARSLRTRCRPTAPWRGTTTRGPPATTRSANRGCRRCCLRRRCAQTGRRSARSIPRPCTASQPHHGHRREHRRQPVCDGGVEGVIDDARTTDVIADG